MSEMDELFRKNLKEHTAAKQEMIEDLADITSKLDTIEKMYTNELPATVELDKLVREREGLNNKRDKLSDDIHRRDILISQCRHSLRLTPIDPKKET
jgi:cell division protein FtsB